MLTKVANFFICGLDTYLIHYFIIASFGKGNINYKKAMVYLIVGNILNTLAIEFFGFASFFGFLIIITVYILVNKILLDKKLYKIVFGVIASILTMAVIEISITNMFIVVFRLKPTVFLEYNVYRIISIIIIKSLFFISIRYIPSALNPLIKFEPKKIKPLFIISLFNVIIVYMTVLLYKYIEIDLTIGYVYIATAGIGTIGFSWIIFSITKDAMYHNQKEDIWKKREEEFYKNDYYLKNIEQILDTIKTQKHDLNNYLSTLYGLIYLESYEEAKGYIKSINNRIKKINSIIETSHPIITALVSIKNNKAMEEEIETEISIDISEKTSFDFVDLSIIIGNLFDNAIEACGVLDDTYEKMIKLTIDTDENNLILNIENTKSNRIIVDTNKIYGRFTTKQDMYNHGLGLGNINFIVKENKGFMLIEDLGDKFVVNITLPIRLQEKYIPIELH